MEVNLPRAPLSPPRPRPLTGGCEPAGVVDVVDGAGVAGSTAAVEEDEVPGCDAGGAVSWTGATSPTPLGGSSLASSSSCQRRRASSSSSSRVLTRRPSSSSRARLLLICSKKKIVNNWKIINCG